MSINFKNPYLKEQIIAYIGNKRRLLPLIYQSLKENLPEMSPGLKFLDLFAGSGVVSRLAKVLEFEVFCNDWENYAEIINRGFIQTNASDIPKLFNSEADFYNLLEKINQLPAPILEEQYIASYYAPAQKDISKADFKRERLFYTRENGLTIDKIRNYIQKNYPVDQYPRQQALLTALLLQQAATHTNTSGVFKACHKGFGGHGKDAMDRILAPITLKKPVLIDSPFPVHIFRQDAQKLLHQENMQNIDVAYLDPPYNQHQYGSNYHLLNTIALWDKIPAPLDLNEKGELKRKAAIRKDWIKTRSDYCYREKAEEAFAFLMRDIQARFILISYSTDGIIPFEAMREICRKKGRLSIQSNEYTKYRGGKQSNQRKNTNIEFVLCIDTQYKSSRLDSQKIDSFLLRKKLRLLFSGRFNWETLKNHISKDDDNQIIINLKQKELKIKIEPLLALQYPEEADNLSAEEIKNLINILEKWLCQNKEEEIEQLIIKINEEKNPDDRLFKELPALLRKLAHKKYKSEFEHWQEKINQLKNHYPQYYINIQEKMKKLNSIAQKRFLN